MMTREHLLQQLANDHGYDDMSAGDALMAIAPPMRSLLTREDQHFFQRHAAESCHDVARACAAVPLLWHGARAG